MPQGKDGTSKCSKVNDRLENHSTWPVVCTRWPIRMALCARDNSSEGGEGIPDWFHISRGESDMQQLSKCFER